MTKTLSRIFGIFLLTMAIFASCEQSSGAEGGNGGIVIPPVIETYSTTTENYTALEAII